MVKAVEIYADKSIASNLGERIQSNIFEDFERVRENEEEPKNPDPYSSEEPFLHPTDDVSGTPAYSYARFRVADRFGWRRLLNAAENAVSDASWYRIKGHWCDHEWTDFVTPKSDLDINPQYDGDGCTAIEKRFWREKGTVPDDLIINR
jgi:hypothetical protein